MANISMICHPQTPARVASAIEVEVERRGGLGIFARYMIRGDTNQLVIPAQREISRSDGLWQTTCFEMFVCVMEEEQYVEYNLSPSRQWAGYHFCDYRLDMEDFSVVSPVIQTMLTKDCLVLEALVTLPDEYAMRYVDLGLSAVVEEKGGAKSYWALRHPQGAPDFHHRDCFAFTLAAPQLS